MQQKIKSNYINTHIVDILGSTKGRDQPIMKMDKAVELVKCLGKDVLKSDDYVFFDPFCKAGEILLAVALVSNMYKQKKEIKGLIKDMYQSDKYYALSPDERHYNLSLRTFFGNERSHNENETKNIRKGSYLSESDGRLDNAKFKKELRKMLEYIKERSGNKKIIAIGNPPYQESDGGFGGSASAIYTNFAEALIQSSYVEEFVLVIPSRWFSTGKGTDKFRKDIIENNYIRSIHHFKYSKEIFPTVDILGGVCFIHYQSSYSGDIYFSIEGRKKKIKLSKDFDIILDDLFGYGLVKKIRRLWKKEFVSAIAWSRNPFGIKTFYFKRNRSLKKTEKNAIPCYSKRRKILYANRKDIKKNEEKINEWKVAIPRAYAPGSSRGVRRVTLPVNQYFIIPKGVITSETYNIVGSFKTKSEAENFLQYLKTDFSRYFLGLRKVTQDIPKDRWKFLPLVDIKIAWTDKKLFKYFKLSKTEQEHIKRKVEEWS